MKTKRVLLLSATLALAACDDGGTDISGGGGGSGDGGSESAKHAGTYQGVVNTKAESKDFGSVTDKSDMTLVIHKDGTVTLTIEGESVQGSISGSKFNIPFKIDWSDDGVTCKGNLVAGGTVSGNTVSGPVSGSGHCNSIGVSTSVKVTGTLSGTKI